MALNWTGLAREVAVKRTAIVVAVTGLIHVVVALHWLTVAQSAETIKTVTGALDFLGASAAALYIRAGVSPAGEMPKLPDLGNIAQDAIGAVVADLQSPASTTPASVPNPNSVV